MTNSAGTFGAGIATGSVSLIGFGADSFIEVISAVALLWRLREAGPDASDKERGSAEKRALYLVAATFFLLAAYITHEAVGALLSGEGPEDSAVGLVLSVVSLLVMSALAYGKQRTGREMGSEALKADAVETWVAPTSRSRCSWVWGSTPPSAGGGPTRRGALAMLPVILWQGFETLGEAREEGEDAK